MQLEISKKTRRLDVSQGLLINLWLLNLIVLIWQIDYNLSFCRTYKCRVWMISLNFGIYKLDSEKYSSYTFIELSKWFIKDCASLTKYFVINWFRLLFRNRWILKAEFKFVKTWICSLNVNTSRTYQRGINLSKNLAKVSERVQERQLSYYF